MIPSSRLAATVAGTAAALFALSAGSAAAHGIRHFDEGSAGRAVFVQTDNLSGNAIAAYDRHADGTLTPAGTYATGGNGGKLAGSVADHLASQNSLVYDAGASRLLAVNAGSDTISLFDVRGDRLQLGQVIGSGGTFPVSIAVHGDLVYVLNALGGGSIQGYRLREGGLVALAGSERSLGLDPTVTPQFVNTPGDIAFTRDGQKLIVTTKANGNNIDVFPVDADGLTGSPVTNNEPGQVPFALAFRGAGQVDVAQAGTNTVASYRLNPDGTLQPLSSVATGGNATCWLVSDRALLFAGNAASATESSILGSPDGTLQLTATTSTDPGTVDGATSPGGRYLYVQTGGNGIVDEFSVGSAGALTQIGSVPVPGGAGGEGIATS